MDCIVHGVAKSQTRLSELSLSLAYKDFSNIVLGQRKLLNKLFKYANELIEFCSEDLSGLLLRCGWKKTNRFGGPVKLLQLSWCELMMAKTSLVV